MNSEDREEVIQALMQVRAQGSVNMFHKSGVRDELYMIGEDFSAEQIGSMDTDDYINILEEMGRRL